MPGPYTEVAAEALTLRDRLALDRTELANERTFLAYVRTALAFLGGGLALLQFGDTAWALVLGTVALPLSVLVSAYGTWRFWSVRRRLGRLEHGGGKSLDI